MLQNIKRITFQTRRKSSHLGLVLGTYTYIAAQIKIVSFIMNGQHYPLPSRADVNEYEWLSGQV